MTQSKHTLGPWIAASHASSVVGLPVVAQSGRSIASVTFFELGEHFDNHKQESYANARLIAAAPELLAALKAMRDLAKKTPGLQGRDFVSLGIQVSNAIQKAGG